MITNDQWKEIALYYQSLTEDKKRDFNDVFREILQDEIDKEVIRELKDTK